MARSVNENGLTEQQEMFVNAYMREGCGCASDAYRIAYPRSVDWKPGAVHNNSSQLLASTQVQHRIREMRRNTAAQSSLTLAQAKDILTGLARTAITDPESAAKVGPVVIKSIERLARLEQWDAPEQIQVEQVSFHLNLAPDAPEEPAETDEARSARATGDELPSVLAANTEEMP